MATGSRCPAMTSRVLDVAVAILRLRLARILISACPSSSFAGCNMGKPEKIPSWRDRQTDHFGRPIRADVRSAAHEVWAEACRRTGALLSDRGQAPHLDGGFRRAGLSLPGRDLGESQRRLPEICPTLTKHRKRSRWASIVA